MNVPVTMRRLWIQMTADRRRFGIFCAMLGVGLLLWARLIVVTNTPRTVVADESNQSAQLIQPTAPAQSETDRRSSVQNENQPPLRLVLARKPQRDPFLISQEHFPIRSNHADTEEVQSKSTPEPAEDSHRSAYERASALAGQLKLEAVMLAPSANSSPLVVINGRTYRLDDEIPVATSTGQAPVRFRLVKVAERSATLEYDGHHFEKTLARPGR